MSEKTDFSRIPSVRWSRCPSSYSVFYRCIRAAAANGRCQPCPRRLGFVPLAQLSRSTLKMATAAAPQTSAVTRSEDILSAKVRPFLLDFSRPPLLAITSAFLTRNEGERGVPTLLASYQCMLLTLFGPRSTSPRHTRRSLPSSVIRRPPPRSHPSLPPPRSLQHSHYTLPAAFELPAEATDRSLPLQRYRQGWNWSRRRYRRFCHPLPPYVLFLSHRTNESRACGFVSACFAPYTDRFLPLPLPLSQAGRGPSSPVSVSVSDRATRIATVSSTPLRFPVSASLAMLRCVFPQSGIGCTAV